jgi:hypothetical protein
MIRSLHTKRDDKGVVALEMVLALPVLITLIIGVVVLGNALSVKTQTMGLARDGARAAALDLELPDNTTIVAGGCPNPAIPDADVTVKATGTLILVSIPFVPDAVLPETIEETVTMRCGG